MDCEVNLSRHNDIANNIVKVENDYANKSLKLHCKIEPSRRGIIGIIKYLNCTDWKNFKFSEYSIRKNEENYIITFSYIPPKVFFK